MCCMLMLMFAALTHIRHQHRLGRFVNDSPTRFTNCAPKVMLICGKHRVLLFATKNTAQNSDTTTEERDCHGERLVSYQKLSKMALGCEMDLFRCSLSGHVTDSSQTLFTATTILSCFRLIHHVCVSLYAHVSRNTK